MKHQPVQFAFLFEAVGLVLALVVTQIYLWISKSGAAAAAKRSVKRLYARFWNGREDDRLFAWYRVRMHLRSEDPDQEKIELVNKAIVETSSEDAQGKLAIDEEGEFVTAVKSDTP